MEVVVSDEATQDVADIEEYLDNENQTAARMFVERIDLLFAWIGEYPKLAPVAGSIKMRVNVRLRTIPGFWKYVVFYTVRQSHVRILRVLHGARDWKRLLNERPGLEGSDA